jgi:hypothetical protein
MDQFYAAVEMKDRPELEGACLLCYHYSLVLLLQRLSANRTPYSFNSPGKPIAVGGNSMLCTANYEGNGVARVITHSTPHVSER